MNSQLSNLGYRIPRTPSNEKKYFKELTIYPEVKTKIKYGPKPKPVICYRKSNSFIYVPRFYGIKTFGKPKFVKEQLIEKIDVRFNGELRDYQKEIIDKTLDNFNNPELQGGILALGTGVGKTVIFLNLIHMLRVKTLVIVHKENLLDQWFQRIEQFLPEARVGIIQGNKIDTKDKDIVIGMLQSVSMRDYPPETFEGIGMLCVDESHCINSKTFSKTLFKVQPKYRLGLSATPKRSDGLDKVMEFHLGPIIYEMTNTIIDPVIHIYPSPRIDVESSLNYSGNTNLPKLITDISNSEERNKFIIDLLQKYIKENRQIIIFSDRVGHCKELKMRFDNLNTEKTCSVFAGKLKKEQREDAITKDIICCSYSMAKEGFDVPKLDTLLFATPRSEITQCIGRILRKKNKNIPVVIDIVDSKYVSLNGMGYKRQRFYREKNYEVTKFDKELQPIESKKKKGKEIEIGTALKTFGKMKIIQED